MLGEVLTLKILNCVLAFLPKAHSIKLNDSNFGK